MDETEYLLSGSANKKHLEESITQLRKNQTINYNPNNDPNPTCTNWLDKIAAIAEENGTPYTEDQIAAAKDFYKVHIARSPYDPLPSSAETVGKFRIVQAAQSNPQHHELAIAAINAYASTIQSKNLSAQEVSDKCAEVYRNTVANLNKILVDTDGKA